MIKNMSMESFDIDLKSENGGENLEEKKRLLDLKIKDLEKRLEENRSAWRQEEDKSYNLRMNNMPSGKRPVDYKKLERGDREEQMLEAARVNALEVADRKKDNLDLEKDAIKKELENLRAEKSRL